MMLPDVLLHAHHLHAAETCMDSGNRTAMFLLCSSLFWLICITILFVVLFRSSTTQQSIVRAAEHPAASDRSGLLRLVRQWQESKVAHTV